MNKKRREAQLRLWDEQYPEFAPDEATGIRPAVIRCPECKKPLPQDAECDCKGMSEPGRILQSKDHGTKVTVDEATPIDWDHLHGMVLVVRRQDTGKLAMLPATKLDHWEVVA